MTFFYLFGKGTIFLSGENQRKIRENLKSRVCGDMLFHLNGMSFRISVFEYMLSVELI